MSASRIILIEALRHVIDGGDITDEQLVAAIPCPAALRGAERKAWHGLSYWADDEDIRARDVRYGPVCRRRLADLLTALMREEDRIG